VFRSSLACVAVGVLVGFVGVGAASAAYLGTSTSPTPDNLVLTPADVPGTTTFFNGPVPGQAVPTYARVFVPKAGRSASAVESVVLLHPDAAHAAAAVDGLNAYASTPAGRQALAKAAADAARTLLASPAIRAKFGITGHPTVSKVTVGLPSKPAADTTALPYTVVLSGVTIHYSAAYVQVDRAIDAVELISFKRAAPTSALAGLIAKARARMQVGFTVANTAAPTLSGTPTVGQTLTLDNGNWSGGAAQFAYLWQRCAADGSTCVPLDAPAGATTYVVSPDDAGSTIRVSVTASNTVSQAQATSTQTVVAS
jgi:hypothetical protein